MASLSDRKLWKGIDMGCTVLVGRTAWTVAPRFMIHQSRAPFPVHKKITPINISSDSVRSQLTNAREHRQLEWLWRAGGLWMNPLDGTELVAFGIGHGEHSRVRMGFHRETWTVIQQKCSGCTFRADVYSGVRSWWRLTKHPYPVAILAGYLTRPVWVPSAEAGRGA